MADKYHARPTYITPLLCFWAAAYLIAQGILLSKSSFHAPSFVVFLGLIFGLIAVLGTIGGLYAVAAGKLSNTWLLINMAVGGLNVGSDSDLP